MARTSAFLSIAALALWLGAAAGCSKPTETPPTDAPAAGMTATDEHGHSHDQATIDAEIAKLPEAERPVAIAQKNCPVSDEPLGTMGMPYKVTVQERDVYLCCKGCEKELKAHPETYLAKLPPK